MQRVIKLNLIKIHSWLGIESNLAISTFYFTIISTFLGCIWAIHTHFYTNASTEPLHNSNILTGNTFNNSPVTIIQNNYSELTFEQYKNITIEVKASVMKDLELSNGAERTINQLKLLKIDAKLSDLEKSYKDTKAENQKLSLALNEFKSKNPKIADQQFIDAQSALQKGDYTKADAVFKEIELGAEEPIASAANAAYQRAKIANNAFRWNDALELASKAKLLQPKNEEYISFYADFLLLTGDSLQAQKLFEQSLQLTINKYGVNSLEAAIQHNRLAEAYRAYNFELAESHNLKAIEIAKTPRQDTPINSLFLGNLYSNLATLYQDNRKYPKAEFNYFKAIAIHEKTLSANHPDLSIDYNNLAGLYRWQYKFKEAEKYQLKSIAIDEQVLPASNSSRPRHYINLAEIYIAQGSHPIDKATFLKANSILLKANALYVKYPPPNQEELGKSYFLLATINFDIGDFKAAEPFYSQAADIAVAKFGIENNMTQGIIKEYLTCVKNQGKDIGHLLKKYGSKVRPANAY